MLAGSPGPTFGMRPSALVPLVALLAIGSLAWESGSLARRLERLEERPPAARTSAVAKLRSELVAARDRLAAERTRAARSAARLADLTRRVERLEGALSLARRRTRDRLAALEERDEHSVAALAQTRTALARALAENSALADTRWRSLEEKFRVLAGDVAEAREASHRQVADEGDFDRAWDELVGPTVQLSGGATVGSGVLLPALREGKGWGTYVLTAWHVVRDIRHGGEDEPIWTRVYAPDGGTRDEVATIVGWDEDLDLCLVRLEIDERLPYAARLPSPEALREAHVFQPVYAVGCPLGNDPIPTYGQITDLFQRIDGERYWMISAPSYVGNSGGPVFDARTHELLGVFTKIYTHGTLRPTVVPHMGLATPGDVVAEWLRTIGYGGWFGHAPRGAVARSDG